LPCELCGPDGHNIGKMCAKDIHRRQHSDENVEKMEHQYSIILFDVSFCEVSAEMGICDDWFAQANINLVRQRLRATIGTRIPAFFELYIALCARPIFKPG